LLETCAGTVDVTVGTCSLVVEVVGVLDGLATEVFLGGTAKGLAFTHNIFFPDLEH
jgi:hypothetical protein